MINGLFGTDYPLDSTITYNWTEFEDDGSVMCLYDVPVIKLPELSMEEMNERKMAALLPFHVLKIRKLIKEKHYGKDELLEELQRVINDDIIGNIEQNVQMGNLNEEDAWKLRMYLNQLCKYLSHHHEELEMMNDMTDESFMTAADLICEKYERMIAERELKLEEMDNTIAEKNQIIKQLQNELEALRKKSN